VLLGGKATVTVRELSTLTITEDPNAATVELSEGKVALHVNKALMKPGDIIQIQTPNPIVGVWGSLVVTEVTGPPDTRQSHVTALEASLPILVAPRSGPNRTTLLRPNQAVTVSGPRHAAPIDAVRMISTKRARREAEAAEMPGHRREAAQQRWAEARAGHAREAKTDRSYPFRRPTRSNPRLDSRTMTRGHSPMNRLVTAWPGMWDQLGRGGAGGRGGGDGAAAGADTG
jgi:hypothetical protein